MKLVAANNKILRIQEKYALSHKQDSGDHILDAAFGGPLRGDAERIDCSGSTYIVNHFRRHAHIDTRTNPLSFFFPSHTFVFPSEHTWNTDVQHKDEDSSRIRACSAKTRSCN